MDQSPNPKGQQSNKNKMPISNKHPINWVTILLVTLFLSWLVFSQLSIPEETSWLNFEQTMLADNDVARIEVINKEIAEIYIKDDRLSTPKYEDVSKTVFGKNPGPHYKLRIGSVEVFEKKLQELQKDLSPEELIEITYTTRTHWSNLLLWLFPIFIIFWLWSGLYRGTKGGGLGGSVFNFGKSTARLFEKDQKSKISFKDVAGLEEAKVEVKEIVQILKNPETFTKLGAKIPKGVILAGPPGTGKTLLAKAVAGEAQVPFFSLSGAEFVEMFVGVGASRVRSLFKRAKEKAPSIIFIDEIDAIGQSRGRGQAFQTNDERENTLNQLLSEMDGFATNTRVIVMAATNRTDILDPALLRPGRFDRHIYLELPNRNEREAIFKVHLRPLKLANHIDPKLLAAQTPGFSGADISNICNEAALIAARKRKNAVEKSDFSAAIDRLIGGLEKKSKIISPKEKKIIAYHEAGHAIAGWFLKNVDPLVKVSIIPRGKSLGSAWYLPQERQILTKSQFMDQICAALGGRAAEEVIFGEVSSGALDDLEKVTKQAYTMVAYYGLDDKIGNISFYDSSGQYDKLLQRPYSEATAKKIDDEVSHLVEQAYERTKALLTKHQHELSELAKLLLKKETVVKEELEDLLGERNKNYHLQPSK